MTWFLNSMEESVSANVMFLTTAKAMWDALHDMYPHEKNISRVYELYERLFSLKQDGRAVSDYFALLKGTSDEILLYHPLSCDARTRKSRWEDFLVAKFLSGLDNNLKIVRDHLLASDSVPTLSNALSRVLRVATGSSDSSSSSGTTTESSAMGVRDRGRSSSRGHGGQALEPSPNPSESDTLSREEYEQLLHCPDANSATPTTSSSPGAFVASHGKSWMLDSGATTHLTVTLFPSYCVFQDLQTQRTIGGGHERGGLYFLNTSPPIDARVLSASVSPLQWHCHLGHSSLPTLQKVLPIKSSRLAFPLPVPTLTFRPHTEPPTRPLQVYSRRNRSTKTTLTAPPSLPPTAAPRNPSATPANDVPIALRKGMVVLAVYVDDILITGSDIVGIKEAKTYLQKHFVTKDLGRPRYFLGIEIAHSKHGISLSQRKYVCDLFQKTGLLGTKPVDTPMDSNPDFLNDDGNYLEDKTKYRRLVGKLIYLTVTRPDISFAVGLVSQFMDKPRLVHWEAALRILKYIKASPGKGLLFKRHGHVKIEAYSDADYAGAKDYRKSTSGYCTYVGGNLVTWRSKKQTTVARSSAKVEYRAMAHTTSEILCLKNLLKELGFMYDDPILMHCDNQAAIHIASNPIFHERTKHIEVDCHFVRETVMSQKICTPFTPSSEKRADIFTKALGGKQFDVLCNKLGIIDIFAPT
ncbi:UNVERIFIED_CONTAM: Retrovirus-related Pol polyprotein from transposon RE2 [Sesamum radiatum]|uniref:Retrovirus-related Pol polyprotein from transposon RE2 n=1 Tax=Sesamum radiatum TaxID=300843 RepID=A0AAW2N0S3_SESRA